MSRDPGAKKISRRAPGKKEGEGGGRGKGEGGEGRGGKERGQPRALRRDRKARRDRAAPRRHVQNPWDRRESCGAMTRRDRKRHGAGVRRDGAGWRGSGARRYAAPSGQRRSPALSATLRRHGAGVTRAPKEVWCRGSKVGPARRKPSTYCQRQGGVMAPEGAAPSQGAASYTISGQGAAPLERSILWRRAL